MTAIALLAVTSCDKSSQDENVSGGVPILIGGQTVQVGTKAAVEAGGAFSAQVIGSLSSKSYAKASIYTDANATPLNQTVSFAATTGNGAFSPAVHYPADGSTVYLTGYAPETGTLTDAGKVTFTIPAAADADIMVATETSGSKSGKNTALALAFQHKMTQVQFKVKATAEGAALWGALTDITVTGQPSAVELDLSSEGFPITASGSASYVAFSGTGDQALALPTGGTASDAGGSLILAPVGTGSFTFTFKTEKSGSEAVSKTIAVVASDPVAGESITLAASQKNVITLDFSASQITVSATVGEWKTGSSIDFPVE